MEISTDEVEATAMVGGGASCRAATPGSSFPSRNSKEAPPLYVGWVWVKVWRIEERRRMI